MADLDWTWFAAATIAPLAVWVLWRVQTLSVELLRTRLVRLVRNAKWLYETVSWFGTLLHELSHALVLVLSGHGIREFKVHAEEGHVTPRHQSRAPWFFWSFLLAALAPLYVPPGLVLVGLILLLDPDLVAWAAADAGTGLAPAWESLRAALMDFPRDLVVALAGLDLREPSHLLTFLLVLLGAPSSRPSHVKGSRFHGTRSEGDVAVMRRRLRERPLWFGIFLALLYGLYFALVPFVPQAYWWPFQAVWAVAITGIVLAVFGALWWSVAHLNSLVQAWIAWLPFAGFLAVQTAARVLEWDLDIVVVNLASVAVWAGASAVLAVVFRRRHWLDRALG